jgi:hypothetical protein
LATFENETVAMVPLSDTTEAIVSVQSWLDYLALGFSPNLSSDSNGLGQFYPRHMVNDPRPGAGRSRAVSLARTLAAISLVKAEMEGGKRAPSKGWVVRHANGSRLDCRDTNLLRVPARGCRNGYRAVWNVRERMRLAAQGLDPNRVFAERRRAERQESYGALSRGHKQPARSVKSPRTVLAAVGHSGGSEMGGAN